MACVIFGVKLKLNDEFYNLVTPLLTPIDRKRAETDIDFLNDLSVPLKLSSGYSLWQVNNRENSYVYLCFSMYRLGSEDEEEFLAISPPSEMEAYTFKIYLKTNGIHATCYQYLVLDDRSS
jgi:hypothetical protein